jgi:hypothetical protein
MARADESQLDDPMEIVNVIHSLATRETNQFRNVIGTTGNQLMELRRSMPIEEYMEAMRGYF